jgi:polysaccharide deacetylase family protein (PEP-CTERM system associated)
LDDFVNPILLLTVDVEDWFQVENFKPYIPFDSWERRERRVGENTRRILRILDSVEVANGSPKVTFFMLGWLAERMPVLVREIVDRGHEIASHGYDHELCTAQSPDALQSDLIRSRKLLEDLTGQPVVGYRAPSFSISEYILTAIASAGYRYDASYNSFEGNRRYGRVRLNGQPRAGIAVRMGDDFWELPVSNLRLGNLTLPWAGGGYFRLLPGPLFRSGIRTILDRDGVYSFYMHPWELDPEQPRVAQASRLSRFRHYLNLHRTAPRLTAILRHFQDAEFHTCREYLRRVASDFRRQSTP